MSVREALIKHLSTILRASDGTILVVLCDLNGLSIAQIGRKSDIEVNPNQITGLASVAFSASEETWIDLDIRDQVISFSYFEKACLITIRMDQILLTIVHDYHREWPLDADSLASAIYFLYMKINEFFGIKHISAEEAESFSNKIRSAIYLFGMGSNMPFTSYTPANHDSSNVLPAISQVLDSIQNLIFLRYSMVVPSGLLLDAREVSGLELPISIEAFSANANVAFQKMKEEASGSTIGELLCYIAISGKDVEHLYGIITAPSGKLKFSMTADSSNHEEVSFVGLFPLEYGGVPVIGEARNIINSVLEILGEDPVTKQFIETVNVLTSHKYEE
ncbi:MAG: hypothetical protein ACTSXH_18520 [Promethearchaeota archaeon]